MISAESIAPALDGHPYADGFMCHCPVVTLGKRRGDHSPSCLVKDGHSALLVHCFAGCDKRDVLEALEERGLLDRTRPAFQNATATVLSRKPSEPEPDQRALELWHSSKSIEGTLAERYLSEHRGLDGPYPPSLRFLPGYNHKASGLRFPAMIAGLSRPDKKIVAVQLTFIRPGDGAKAQLNMPRLNIGRMGTGAVHLTDGAIRIGELGLAEGIETALSATALSGVPTWATLGATRLANITIPSSVKTVHIFADGDQPGEYAARRAADKYEAQGKRVIVHRPASQFADFNDRQRHLSGRRG